MILRQVSVIFSIILVSSVLTTVSFVEAKFPENLPDVSKAPQKVRVIETENITAYARTLYTTLDDPVNHESGSLFYGVARLSLPSSDGNTYGCSGSLLSTGKHVLTAAHCVTDNNGVVNLLSGGTATFQGTFGTETIGILGASVHNSYDGDFLKGNDIAIVELSSVASSGVTRYDYATNDNSVGQVRYKIGYGISGKFKTGDDPSNYPFGTKRDGLNNYDAFADIMYLALGLQPNTDYVPQAIYQFDSDDGRTNHDAFGFFFNLSDLGLGNEEVMSAPGDSGGPTLSDENNDGTPDTIVGITSYGITLQYNNGQSSDCTRQFGSVILDSSCGEFSGDTRVSSYTSFIIDVIDYDGDGIFNDDDNCPNTSNPSQIDDDLDGIGNICDVLPLDPNRQCINQTGDWNNAGSWVPFGVPSSLERLVMINCNLTVQDGETVVVSNMLDVDSTSVLNLDGDMTVTSQVNLDGTANVNSNTLLVFGTFNIQSGGIHNINAAGLTKVKSGGTFNVQSGGIENNAGKHVTQHGGTTSIQAGGTVNNSNLYTTFEGAIMTLAGEMNQAKTNNVFGTFTIQPGGVYDNESGSRTEVTSVGIFTVESGGTANSLGTHITQGGGATIILGQWTERSGSVNEVSGILSVGTGGIYSSNTNSFTKVKSGGTFDVQTGGIENNAGKHVTQSGGTTSIQAGGTVNNSNLYTTFSGGIVTLAGELNQAKTNNVFGTFTIQPGGVYDNESGSRTDVSSPGIFTVESGGIVNNSADFYTNVGATTDLLGLWNELFGNTNTIFGTFNVASGGIYDNEVNGLTKIQGGGNFNLQNGGKVNNFGKFVVLTGGMATLDDDYDNNLDSKTSNFGIMNVDCNGMFNDFGGIFVGDLIVNICAS